MDVSALGAWITFQVTFTEFFISATVLFSVAYRYGWRSGAIGSTLGLVTVVTLSLLLQATVQRVALHLIDWISTLLLLGFGVFLFYEFLDGLKRSGEADVANTGTGHLPQGLSLVGVGVAAWAMIAEGVEVMVVWLAVSLKQGWAVATAGVGIGALVIAVTAVLLGKSGVFRKIPAPYLDFAAATMVSGYGIYFLTEALKNTAT